MTDLFVASDGQPRCGWCAATDQYIAYHDHEWGFPVADDRRLFEKICLEGFQSGLSWRTILERREGFRRAFQMFDFDKVSAMGPQDVERLVHDTSIIRHRGKIEATLNNARCACEMRDEFGSLAAYFWQFEDGPTQAPQTRSVTETSTRLSKDLKARGWKFVGPTTCFAFMQAMGLVNDHAEGCVTRAAVAQARAEFSKP